MLLFAWGQNGGKTSHSRALNQQTQPIDSVVGPGHVAGRQFFLSLHQHCSLSLVFRNNNSYCKHHFDKFTKIFSIAPLHFFSMVDRLVQLNESLSRDIRHLVGCVSVKYCSRLNSVDASLVIREINCVVMSKSKSSF